MPSSPWANISVSEPANLQDIMSEEALQELKVEGNKKSANLTSISKEFEDYVIVSNDIPLDCENDIESDQVIARLLQQQFDDENTLKHTKHSANTRLNIPILFSDNKYMQNLDVEESEEEEENVEDFHGHKDWDQSETIKDEITTYYDLNFRNESGGTFHSKGAVKKIQNSLKFDGKSNQTIIRKLDENTKRQLNNMIENKILKRVNCVISLGKEAAILHAEYYLKCGQSRECLLKVLLTSPGKGKFYKRDLKLRVENEIKNFLLLKKAEILCPEVLGFKNNILIMSIIGKGLSRARTLQNSVLTTDEYGVAHMQILVYMSRLYSKSKLIYTNWSESNILWFNSNCYIIDPSQVIKLKHIDDFNLLMTSCINIAKFFHKKGPYYCATSPEELIQRITWFNLLMTSCINITKFFHKEGPYYCATSPEDLIQKITWYDFNNKYRLEANIKSLLLEEQHWNKPK